MKSISNYESINSVSPSYIVTGKTDWYIGEKDRIKYFTFASTFASTSSASTGEYEKDL